MNDSQENMENEKTLEDSQISKEDKDSTHKSKNKEKFGSSKEKLGKFTAKVKEKARDSKKKIKEKLEERKERKEIEGVEGKEISGERKVVSAESKDITTKSKFPIPEIIHRVGVENLNLKKEFTCTDDQLRKNLYIFIVVFIIFSISISFFLAFPAQPRCTPIPLTDLEACNWSPVTSWALGLGFSIGFALMSIISIFLYKLKPEKLKYLIERKRIIIAKRKAMRIDKKMKKKNMVAN